jgi:TonB family protein
VREQASHDLRCPRDSLGIEPVDSTFQVAGCDQRATYVCSREAGAELCWAIGRGVVPVKLRERIVRAKASRLLDCEPDAIDVQSKNARYVARGCGRRITYECTTRADCCAFTKPGAVPVDGASPAVKGLLDRIAQGKTRAKGTLRKEDIRAVFEAEIAQVRACYEAELQREEWHAGTVAVQFIIDPDGVVQTAALHSSSLGVPRAEQCIVDVVKRLRFAKPETGIVVVTYPFVLLSNPLGKYAPCP